MHETGDGNAVYWETCGNPAGLPVLVVHGGPGAGCSPGLRRSFDPERYRMVLFDQRNCVRSTPHASDPVADMSLNTTDHLIGDMEALRERLGIGRWVLFGGSWGVTLSLAYGQRYPGRVLGMLLVGVMTSRRSELDWLYRGVGRIFPEAWARFRAHARADLFRQPTDQEPPIEHLLAAYSWLMEDADPQVRLRAAVEWLAWEDAVISMESGGKPGSYSNRFEDDAKLAFVRICAHYFSNGAFLDDGVLVGEAGQLAGIPGVLVHGRADMGCPVVTAWELTSAWPGAELIVVDDSGHTAGAALQEALRVGGERCGPRLADRRSHRRARSGYPNPYALGSGRGGMGSCDPTRRRRTWRRFPIREAAPGGSRPSAAAATTLGPTCRPVRCDPATPPVPTPVAAPVRARTPPTTIRANPGGP